MTCDSCSVPCEGSLQSSDPDESGTSCTCSFNKVHIVWMVAVGLAVIGLIAFGVVTFMKKRSAGRQYNAAPGRLDNQMSKPLKDGTEIVTVGQCLSDCIIVYYR